MSEELEFAFIDVQGFKTIGNTFIVKEFCIIHDDFVFHNIVKSPCKFNQLLTAYRREANWVSCMYHGLTFDSGTITLHELIKNTLDHVDGKTIIVKGHEKVEWVKQIYEKWCDIQCENIEDYHSFSFSSKKRNEIVCAHHKKLQPYANCHCALSNARELSDFYNNDLPF